MRWTRRRCLAAGWGLGARTLGTPALAAGAYTALSGCGPAPVDLPPGGWVEDLTLPAHRWRDGLAPASASSMGSIQHTGVAIIGAGVAGLSAARALRQCGIDDFRVFELAPASGGNARSHELRGLACPLGAHYLPLPGPEMTELRALLLELGLLRWERGALVAEERHQCHAPQERAWIQGRWQEGQLPINGMSARTLAQYRQFAQALEAATPLGFSIPTRASTWSAAHAELDAQTFSHWLQARGLNDRWLLAYLDYACRDDFGAGIEAVSAWAGLHYFASRHGFHAPGEDSPLSADESPVFTWPQGNDWITRGLSQPLGDRLHTRALVTQLEIGRHAVEVQVWPVESTTVQRWQARHVIVCTPLFVAARLLRTPPPALLAATAHLQYAPWLVSNLHLRAPLLERVGTTMAWDNVGFEQAPGLKAWPPSLGYVNATHQSMHPVPGPTVLTHYWALGGATAEINQARRRALMTSPWTVWAQRVLDDLALMHPDLAGQCDDIALQRWGHAMAIPTPGSRGHPALAALADAPHDRLHFAHSDLSAYSVFEEAFAHGHRAGLRVAQALSGR